MGWSWDGPWNAEGLGLGRSWRSTDALRSRVERMISVTCSSNIWVPPAFTSQTREELRAAPEADSVPEGVIERRSLFFRCSQCRKIYWEGFRYLTAMERLSKQMSELAVAVARPPLEEPGGEG